MCSGDYRQACCDGHLTAALCISDKWVQRVLEPVGAMQDPTPLDYEAALISDSIELASQCGCGDYRRITALLGGLLAINKRMLGESDDARGCKYLQAPKRGCVWLNDGSRTRLRPKGHDYELATLL
jgi:hypothetical protein